ncbi:hypothetical protein GJAV_G00138760 [Gymnothorax javanicus]|nr:hypothetical protein GJAV_G00138760 [Gymnothorax javanicus]
MHSAAYCVGAFILSAMLYQANSSVSSDPDTITALYGEVIEVPCSVETELLVNPILVKWKYVTPSGSGDILTKDRDLQDVTMMATNSYKDRASLAPNASLLIADASLEDEGSFTCMVAAKGDIKEISVTVKVQKRPSAPQINNWVSEVQNGKLTKLGECATEDAHPPAEVTWSKNGVPLVNDDKTVVTAIENIKDPATGLTSTISTLQYATVKADSDAKFVCTVKHSVGPEQSTDPMTFVIRYPTEKLELQVVSKEPIKEGDNVTLKCSADGNPPPTGFNFFLKDKKETVMNSDTYTLADVTRDSSGEYKCSLHNDDSMQHAKNITVHFLDISLEPSGEIVKNLGENLAVTVQQNSSGEVQLSWTKDNGTLNKQPTFDDLKYSDAGVYVCEFSTAGIKQSRSFQLVVQGKPSITSVTETRGEDGEMKVLTCEAEGAPKPRVQWSINYTEEEISYENGKLTHRITVEPKTNLNVSCTVINDLGMDAMTLTVSSLIVEEEKKGEGKADDGDDQAKLIVGIVVGLILAAAIVGLVYWLYMKKSRQGSWKTGEKESETVPQHSRDAEGKR